MPTYNFKCSKCSGEFQKLLPHLTDFKRPCPKCGEPSEYVGRGPTTRVVEVRDNGFMPKKIEQLADIEDLVRDRSTKKPDDDIV